MKEITKEMIGFNRTGSPNWFYKSPNSKLSKEAFETFTEYCNQVYKALLELKTDEPDEFIKIELDRSLFPVNINIPITKPSLPVYDVITENENLNKLFTYVDGSDYVFRYCRYAWTTVRKSYATAYFFRMWTQCKNCDNSGLDKTFEFVK